MKVIKKKQYALSLWNIWLTYFFLEIRDFVVIDYRLIRIRELIEKNHLEDVMCSAWISSLSTIAVLIVISCNFNKDLNII